MDFMHKFAHTCTLCRMYALLRIITYPIMISELIMSIIYKI